MSSGECPHELELRSKTYLKLIKCNRQSFVIFVYLPHIDCVTHHAKEEVRGDLLLDKYKHRVKVTDQIVSS